MIDLTNLSTMNTITGLIKFVFGIPSTLHRTLPSEKLGLTTGPRTDLRYVRTTHHVKQIQYVEPQEVHFFSRPCIRNISTSAISVSAYIDMNEPEERSYGAWQIPPKTFCELR
jgi:hypothetical protein